MEWMLSQSIGWSFIDATGLCCVMRWKMIGNAPFPSFERVVVQSKATALIGTKVVPLNSFCEYLATLAPTLPIDDKTDYKSGKGRDCASSTVCIACRLKIISHRDFIHIAIHYVRYTIPQSARCTAFECRYMIRR